MSRPRRVLIVDDSPVVRSMVERRLGARSALEVVGAVESGAAALRALGALRPDAVLLDACMPGMDGLETTRAIRARMDIPVILMTGKLGAELRRYQVLGISAGASWVLPKGSFQDEVFAAKIEQLICGRSSGRGASGVPVAPSRGEPFVAPTAPPAGALAPSVVGIVASTGGPQTLVRVLRQVPADHPSAFVLVQHMADGFEDSFLALLRTHLHLRVELATDGMTLSRGTLLVAPTGVHLAVRGHRVRLDRTSPPEANHKPSGNMLLRTLALSHRSRAWGVVLTGMGEDGARGLLAMRQAGAHTIAQDAASAVLDGMPRRARELGAAAVVLSDVELGRYLAAAARRAA